jgi:hypothetical protein
MSAELAMVAHSRFGRCAITWCLCNDIEVILEIALAKGQGTAG